MDKIKNYLIDFAEGRVSVPDFLAYCESNPQVLDFLTEIAASSFKTVVVHKSVDEDGVPWYTPEELPFDAKLCIEEEMKCGGTLGKYLNIHHQFSRVLISAFPEENITMDDTLGEKFSFMLNACPEYIGGPDVDFLLEDLMESLPENLSKTKKIKLYKERVKELFHIEPKKYPRWVQDPEWPLGEDGVPMKFIAQNRKKDGRYEACLFTEFIFEDVKTGKQITVEQFT